MAKLETAVFVKMAEQVNQDKTYLCHINPMRDKDKAILKIIGKEDDLYGCSCIVKTKRGDSKGYIVSNILKMSPHKMRNLALSLNGYYPLAEVLAVELKVPVDNLFNGSHIL